MKKQSISILLGIILFVSCKKQDQYSQGRTSFPYENKNILLSEHGQNLTVRNVRKLHFINKADGVMLSDGKIFTTHNGGTSWDLKYGNDTAGLNLDNLLFIDAKTAYAPGFIYGKEGSIVGAMLLKSTDAGNSWTTIYSETGYVLFETISMNSNGDLFMLRTGTSNNSTGNKSIIKSTNEGNTWKSVFSSNDYFLTDLTFNGNTGFASGTLSKNGEAGKGIILKSLDNGNLWSESSRFSDELIRQITFKEGIGYCNAHMAVYRTTNNGNDWQVVYNKPAHTINNIVCVSAKKCILTGSGPNTVIGCIGSTGSALTQTSDGGESWNTVLLNYEPIIQPLSFYSTTDGYAFNGTNLLHVKLKE